MEKRMDGLRRRRDISTRNARQKSGDYRRASSNPIIPHEQDSLLHVNIRSNGHCKQQRPLEILTPRCTIKEICSKFDADAEYLLIAFHLTCAIGALVYLLLGN
jgi:hypothetical protein